MRPSMALVISFVSCAAVTLPGRPASADAPPPPTADEPKVWRFPCVHPAEMAVTGVFLAGSTGLRFGADWEDDPAWHSGILFDQAVVDAALVEDPDAHRAWAITGDVAWIGSMVWTGAEPVIAGAVYDWRVGAQIAWMNAEAFSVLTVALWTSQFALPRRRPVLTELCSPADRAADRELEGFGRTCGGEDSGRSFIGGHVAVTATAAALTCFHHAYTPLYGGGVPDAVPCATGILSTGLVFAARTMTATHYFSDNALGVGVGVLSAMVPWGLHYARGSAPDVADGATARKPLAIQMLAPVVTPTADQRGALLGISGVL